MPSSMTYTALTGVPEIPAGTDLAEMLHPCLQQNDVSLASGDILVVAQKIVSKAEGRLIALSEVQPGAEAERLAAEAGKDPRLVELMLQESAAVLRVKPGVIICEHRLGFIMANAGIDQSNVAGDEVALLLPLDPDASARQLRNGMATRCGVAPAVVIIDSFGRPWRNGVVGTAIGVAGLPALVDLRGTTDRHGRVLRVTQVAAADELAAGASLLMGQGAQGTPVIHVRGFPYPYRDSAAAELLRPPAEDMFR